MKAAKKTLLISVCFLICSMASGCSLFERIFGWSTGFSNREGLKYKDEENIALFMSQVRAKPGNSEANYTIGRYYQQSGRHREAIEAFRKAVSMKPDSADAYNMLAMSCDMQGDFAEAEKAYLAALGINPKDAGIYNNLGHSYALQERWEEAIAFFKKAIELSGNLLNPKIMNNLGRAYAMAGHYEEGMEAFEQAGGKAEAHYRMARVYSDMGMINEARGHYASALLLNPSSLVYRGRLEQCEQEIKLLKFTQQVKDAVEKAQSTSPDMQEDNRQKQQGNARIEICKAKDKTMKKVRSVSLNRQIKIRQNRYGGARIEICNGNGADGMASDIAQSLRRRGFNIVRVTNAGKFNQRKTVIYYKKKYGIASSRLAKHMTKRPKITKVSRLERQNVDLKLVLGKDAARHPHLLRILRRKSNET